MDVKKFLGQIKQNYVVITLVIIILTAFINLRVMVQQLKDKAEANFSSIQKIEQIHQEILNNSEYTSKAVSSIQATITSQQIQLNTINASILSIQSSLFKR